MKKVLQAITLMLMFSVFASSGIAQEIQLAPSTNPVTTEVDRADKDGEWINYWENTGDGGVNENALGLGGDAVAQWFAAIRWSPDDLAAYEGWSVTTIRIFINDEPDNASVKIWQGDISEPVEYVSQAMMTAEEDWVEVELFDPYLIDTSQELWIGWEIGDLGDGNFPAAFTIGGEFSPMSDLLQFGDNPWQPAADVGFDLSWNIEAFVTPGDEPVETYTVSFDVQNADGDHIDDAVIELGPFTNEAGDYVFEDVPEGTHPYTVSAPGYGTVSDEVTVEDDMTVEVVLPDAEMYSATFNVDMTGVEGFDPDEHHVFMTGTPTDWAEPGSDESVHMTLVEPAKDEHPPYTFYENFQDYDDFTTDLSPWVTIQLTEGPTWGVSDFSFPGEGEEWAWMVLNPSETDPAVDDEHPPIDGDKYGIAIQYTDFDDDKWLISPEFSMHETSVLSFHARSMTAAYGLERIRVLVSTTGDDPGNFIPVSDEPYIEVPTDWTEYTFDLSDYAGEPARFAINYVSEDAFIFMIDAITLDADVEDNGNGDDEELVYTATVDLAEGMHEYKYFSDAFGDGWEGGEWDGDPNRTVNVTEDNMVIDDVWGEEPASVVEVDEDNLNMVIYPNPASSVINVNVEGNILDVKVYDVSGRMVMQSQQETLNVSNLTNGLYFMQVTTTEGIETQRFNVAR